ncbi:MAG: hypothetical protein ACT4N5_03005 [Nitrosopumilaceae archaeon]
MKSKTYLVFIILTLCMATFYPGFNSANAQSTVYNESSADQEIILEKTLQINILLVGDTWSSTEIADVKNNLRSSFKPIVESSGEPAGIKYNYEYNFLSASEKDSTDLFSFMKDGKYATPIFGENLLNFPIWQEWWQKVEHPELEDITYGLIDAEKVEEYIYKNLIADDPNLNKPNSANLIFIKDSLDKVDFLHNYYVKNTDKSTKTDHGAVGFMGYGGNYNVYFFDLYAVPWVELDFENSQWYVPSHMQNLNDCTENSCLGDLVSSHVNSALLHVITPSFLYPVDYADHYVIDLVFYSQPSMEVGLTPQTAVTFLDENAIKSELEYLYPFSQWDIQLSFEKRQTSGISYDFKQELERAQIPVDYEYGDYKYSVNLLNSTNIQPHLLSWASERHPTNNEERIGITDSSRTIPVVISVNTSPVYLDQIGIMGFAPALLDNPSKACCAFAVTDDEDIWENKIGLSDLVLHEVGHTLGLAHPFDGWDGKKSAYDRNTYWNWYASPMTYSMPPSGCGILYQLIYGDICGIGSHSFTEFEREYVSNGVLVSLTKKIEADLVTFRNSNPSDYKSGEVNSIEANLEKAKEQFRYGNTLSDNGAIAYSLKAAAGIDSLLGGTPSQTFTKLESESSSPFGTLGVSPNEILFKTHSSTEVSVSGKVNGYMKGQSVEIKLTKPDGTIQELKTIAGSDGSYKMTILADKSFVVGKYKILAKYLDQTSTPVSFVVVSEKSTSQQTMQDDVEKETIPSWVKKNALWWSEGAVGDSDFVQGIQFLIKQKIINIPETKSSTGSLDQKIPSWIKKNAGWWASGQISEDDFIKGIQYLIEHGAIKI